MLLATSKEYLHVLRADIFKLPLLGEILTKSLSLSLRPRSVGDLGKVVYEVVVISNGNKLL